MIEPSQEMVRLWSIDPDDEGSQQMKTLYYSSDEKLQDMFNLLAALSLEELARVKKELAKRQAAEPERAHVDPGETASDS